MIVIRNLCLLVAAIGILSFTGGCNSSPGDPATRTDRPATLDTPGTGGEGKEGEPPGGIDHNE